MDEERWDIRDRVMLARSDQIMPLDMWSTYCDTDATDHTKILQLSLCCGWHKIMVYCINTLWPIPWQINENKP
jgi:hypothetical protein